MNLSIESLVQGFQAITLDANIQKLNRVFADIQNYFSFTETEMNLLPIVKIREKLQGEILHRAIEENRADIIRRIILPFPQSCPYEEAKRWLRRNK